MTKDLLDTMPGKDPLDRAPYLLMALVEKAIKLGELNNPIMQSSPELAEANETFELAQTATVEAVSIAIREARSYRATLQSPKTTGEALARLEATQAMYDQRAKKYVDLVDGWTRADGEKSRVRLRCVEALMTPIDQGGRGLVYTRAEKEASAHPDYAEHKDYCNRLAIEKTEAEIEMKIAEQALETARTVLGTFLFERS